MDELEAIKLFKCLADKSRLLILKSLVKAPMYVELLAQRLQLTPSTISFHLKKLEDAHIVKSTKEQYYTIYSINEDILKSAIIDFINEESSERDLQNLREEEYRRKVINSFFESKKLKAIPVQRKKRVIILKEILKAFEVGREYTEREVNIIIADYNDDFCRIRREMIMEKMMTRKDGIYRLIPDK